MKAVIKKTIAYLALLVIVIYVITGFGMTKSETMEKISFGVLTKSISHSIHENLLIPLIILLLAHLILATDLISKFKREKVLNKL